MVTSDSAPQALSACPLCRADAFTSHQSGAAGVVECGGCGLVMRNPQPSDAVLREIYGPGYFFGDGDRDMEAATSSLKSATADFYLDAIEAYRGGGRRGVAGLRLLDIGCGHGDLLARARARGYQVFGTDVSADAVRRVEARLGPGVATRGEAAAMSASGPFDVCVLSDVIEHARDPGTLLQGLSRMLAPDGTLFISTPSVGHWSARILGRHWMEFKEEHLFYFDPRTIHRLLEQCRYDQVVIQPSLKRLNVDYLAAHFHRFHVPLLRPAIGVCHRLMPGFMRRWPFSIRTGGIVVMARARGAQP